MPKIPNSPLGQAKNASKLASKAPKPAGPGPATGLRQRKAAELKAKLEGGPPSPATPTLPATLPNPPIQPSGMRQVRAAQLKAKMEVSVRTADQPPPEEAPLNHDTPCEGGTGTDEQAVGAGPVGQGEHIVRQGECISSIAKDTGHFWETIWNDPANTELREVRQNPNVLLPEDRVHVPPIRRKEEPGETEMRHRFVRHGEPAMFRIRVLHDDEPCAGEPYVVDVDGATVGSGSTSADGLVQFAIPGNARSGVLRVGEGDDQLKIRLQFGHLQPIAAVAGMQERLNNMGYHCGTADGRLGPRTRAALQSFQSRCGLPPTGDADEATRRTLQEQYGS